MFTLSVSGVVASLSVVTLALYGSIPGHNRKTEHRVRRALLASVQVGISIYISCLISLTHWVPDDQCMHIMYALSEGCNEDALVLGIDPSIVIISFFIDILLGILYTCPFFFGLSEIKKLFKCNNNDNNNDNTDDTAARTTDSISSSNINTHLVSIHSDLAIISNHINKFIITIVFCIIYVIAYKALLNNMIMHVTISYYSNDLVYFSIINFVFIICVLASFVLFQYEKGQFIRFLACFMLSFGINTIQTGYILSSTIRYVSNIIHNDTYWSIRVIDPIIGLFGIIVLVLFIYMLNHARILNRSDVAGSLTFRAMLKRVKNLNNEVEKQKKQVCNLEQEIQEYKFHMKLIHIRKSLQESNKDTNSGLLHYLMSMDQKTERLPSRSQLTIKRRGLLSTRFRNSSSDILSSSFDMDTITTNEEKIVMMDDKELMGYLRHPLCFEVIKDTLRNRICSEMAEFFYIVSLYEECIDRVERKLLAQHIVELYISKGSSLEINVSEQIKRDIHKNILLSPVTLFNDCKREIVLLIKTNVGQELNEQLTRQFLSTILRISASNNQNNNQNNNQDNDTTATTSSSLEAFILPERDVFIQQQNSNSNNNRSAKGRYSNSVSDNSYADNEQKQIQSLKAIQR